MDRMMPNKPSQASSWITFISSVVLAIGCTAELVQGLFTGQIPLGGKTYVDVAAHPVGYWAIIVTEALLVALFVFGVVLSLRMRTAPSDKNAVSASSPDERSTKGG